MSLSVWYHILSEGGLPVEEGVCNYYQQYMHTNIILTWRHAVRVVVLEATSGRVGRWCFTTSWPVDGPS